MADDERRAEIEAVARAFGYRPTPPGEWARALRMAEGAIAALDRVRDARGDDATELVVLREAVIEHRKHHPTLTSNADTELWWKAGFDG